MRRTTPSCRFGTKISKPGQRLSEQSLILGVQQRQRGFVAVAQPIPQFDGVFSIPGNL